MYLGGQQQRVGYQRPDVQQAAQYAKQHAGTEEGELLVCKDKRNCN